MPGAHSLLAGTRRAQRAVIIPPRDENGWYQKHRPISAASSVTRLRDTLASMEVSIVPGLSPGKRRSRDAQSMCQIRAKYGVKTLCSPRSSNGGRTIQSAPPQRRSVMPSADASIPVEMHRAKSSVGLAPDKMDTEPPFNVDASMSANEMPPVNPRASVMMVPTGDCLHNREIASYLDPHQQSWTRANYKRAALMRRGAVNACINSPTADALKRRQYALNRTLSRLYEHAEDQWTQSSAGHSEGHSATEGERRSPRRLPVSSPVREQVAAIPLTVKLSPGSVLQSPTTSPREGENVAAKPSGPKSPRPVIRAGGGFSMDCGLSEFTKHSSSKLDPPNPRALLYATQMAAQHERQKLMHEKRGFVRGPGSLQVVASGFQLSGNSIHLDKSPCQIPGIPISLAKST